MIQHMVLVHDHANAWKLMGTHVPSSFVRLHIGGRILQQLGGRITTRQCFTQTLAHILLDITSEYRVYLSIQSFLDGYGESLLRCIVDAPTCYAELLDQTSTEYHQLLRQLPYWTKLYLGIWSTVTHK